MQWATPSTDVDTKLPESVVEFLDFKHTRLKLKIFPVLLALNVLYVEVDEVPSFFALSCIFRLSSIFFPTMVQFAFGIVVPFSLSEALTSYQATCSENKSVLRGHYVNREYKPDVSPKIYINSFEAPPVKLKNKSFKMFLNCKYPESVLYSSPSLRDLCKSAGISTFPRTKWYGGGKTLDWIFIMCIL